MTPSQLQAALAWAFKHQFNFLIKGKPGGGKTDIIKQATADAGQDFILSHPVVSDPTDYKGLPANVKGQADFLPYGELRKAMEATVPTIFFMDDVGQAPEAVQKAIMQLILAREINGKPVSKYVTFIAATNRKEDKAGVGGMLEPVKSRFASIIELEVNTNDWVHWALTKGNMPIELVAFIQFRPQLLDNFQPTKDLVNSPCPRTVAHVGKMMNAGIPTGLEQELIKGAAGEDFATELIAFLELYRSLPDVDRIWLDPDKVDMPAQLDIQYALSAAIAHRITEPVSNNAFKFIQRFPAELAMSCVKAMTTKKPEMLKTEGYVRWAGVHGNKILQ